jgi:hypothetical protein
MVAPSSCEQTVTRVNHRLAIHEPTLAVITERCPRSCSRRPGIGRRRQVPWRRVRIHMRESHWRGCPRRSTGTECAPECDVSCSGHCPDDVRSDQVRFVRSRASVVFAVTARRPRRHPMHRAQLDHLDEHRNGSSGHTPPTPGASSRGRPPSNATARRTAGGRCHAGGAKNSSAIPSGSRKETPEP